MDLWLERALHSVTQLKRIRLSDGRIIEVEAVRAKRLVRKFGAAYVTEAATLSPKERAVMPSPRGH